MKKHVLTALAIGALFCTSVGQAKSLRASEMTNEQWSQITARGPEDTTVEFREGDEIPVSFSSEGDLLETVQTGVSYVKVKKGFWLRLSEKNVQISLDGATFKSLSDVISGSFTAGAGANVPGVPVNAINLVLKAVLK